MKGWPSGEAEPAEAAASTAATRAYFAGSGRQLLQRSPREIAAELSRRIGLAYLGDERAQIAAWEREASIIQDALKANEGAEDWGVLLELPILRLARRLDAVFLIGQLVVVAEFKMGAMGVDASAIEQVEDYALCLRDFHEASHTAQIVPVVVAEHAAVSVSEPSLTDGISPVLATNAQDLAEVLRQLAAQAGAGPQLDALAFDQARYNPTPTIIEAAKALYAGHSVQEIGRSDATGEAIAAASTRLHAIARQAEARRSRTICFVTGTPGAGKTLLGLNLVFEESELLRGRAAAMLSGNPPLVFVIQEALAADTAGKHGGKKEARRRAQAALQNLTGYLHQYARAGVTEEPPEHVIVYDEAQRAWNAAHGKKQMDRERSEPSLFLEVMERKDWCCLVCLVGPGQEINSGEEGLALWGEALQEAALNGSRWEVHASPITLRTSPALVGAGLLERVPEPAFAVTEEPLLHLSAGLRAFRNTRHGAWVEALLSGDLDAASRLAAQMDSPPAFISRDLATTKRWLADNVRGGRRAGLLSSSRNVRSIPDGVPLSPRSNELQAVAHWFLRPKGDFRSSNALETPLSEYVCQGLEVDAAGVCWGLDLPWADSGWMPRKINGAEWRIIRDPEGMTHRLNAYRVLLTRARSGLVIFVPHGDGEDITRRPAEFDAVFHALLSAGCREVGSPDALA